MDRSDGNLTVCCRQNLTVEDMTGKQSWEMREWRRYVPHLTTCLRLRIGISAEFLVYYFASVKQHCDSMVCTVYYDWDKLSVVIALLLSVVILAHAAFDVAQFLMGAQPTTGSFETPPQLTVKICCNNRQSF